MIFRWKPFLSPVIKVLASGRKGFGFQPEAWELTEELFSFTVCIPYLISLIEMA